MLQPIQPPGAARGANADITALLGLLTPLTPSQGGTGAASVGASQVTVNSVTDTLVGRLAALFALLSAAQSGTLFFRTKALLDANTTALSGVVDSDGANNGTYGRTTPNDAGTPWLRISLATVPALDLRVAGFEASIFSNGAAPTNPYLTPRLKRFSVMTSATGAEVFGIDYDGLVNLIFGAKALTDVASSLGLVPLNAAANPYLTPRIYSGLQSNGASVVGADPDGNLFFNPNKALTAALTLSTQLPQDTALTYNGLVARIDPATGDRLILRHWEGLNFLARQLKASTSGTAVISRMARTQAAKLAPMSNAAGQSNMGAAAFAIFKDEYAPHILMMLSNGVCQITGTNKYTNSLDPTDLIPYRDLDSLGGQTIAGMAGVALSYIELQDGLLPSMKLFAASYRGGTNIQYFLNANQSPETDPASNVPGTGPDGQGSVHTNLNTRLLFTDFTTKALLYDVIPWCPSSDFGQGEATTPADVWESVGGQVLEEESLRMQQLAIDAQTLAVQRGQTIPTGADVRPQMIVQVSPTAFQQTTQNTSTIGQFNLLLKQQLGTSTLACKATGVPMYVGPSGPRGAGIHIGWLGRMPRAEQIACSKYEIAKDPTKLFPIIRFDTIAVEGNDVVFTLAGNPYATLANIPRNIEANPGSPFRLTDDWIDRYMPPTITKSNGDVVKTYGLSYGGATNAPVIQSVTEEWVNIGNGYLQQQFRIVNDVAPTGSWSLQYAMKAAPVANADTAGSTNKTGLNWDAFRGSICVRSPWRSYFRKRFYSQMSRMVVPEYMQIWMIPQQKAYAA